MNPRYRFNALGRPVVLPPPARVAFDAARDRRVAHLERLAHQAETPGGTNHYLSLLVRMHAGKDTVSI